jgi:hypothetical protein
VFPTYYFKVYKNLLKHCKLSGFEIIYIFKTRLMSITVRKS